MKHFKSLLKFIISISIVMCLINKFIESTSLYRHLLKHKGGAFFDWRHGKIFYTKEGSGPPILLIHDLHPASSQQEWSEVIKRLSKNRTVYAIDLLGCGRSDKPPIIYSNYLYTQLIADFTKTIIQRKTDVVATGKSGSFIISSAKMHPESFNELTIINPESFRKLSSMPDTPSKMIKAIIDCPVLGVSLYYLLMSLNIIEEDFEEKYFYNSDLISDKMIYAYYEAAHISGGRGRYLYSSIQSHFVNLDIRPIISGLEKPIHLIFGDTLENAHVTAESYEQLNNQVKITFVEKTKMLPQLEAPETFSDIILNLK